MLPYNDAVSLQLVNSNLRIVLTAAIACWHLGIVPTRAQTPAPNPIWTYSTLRDKLEKPLADESQAVQLFEEMGFFHEAANFPIEAFFGGSQITTPLTEALHFLHYENHRESRRAVADHVKNRQPRTFGVDLVSALLERDASPKIWKFILDRGKEFTKLSPEAAWGLIIALREAMPGVDDLETEPSLQRMLLPLKNQENKQVAAMTEKFFELKNWAQAGPQMYDYISRTVELLRLLGRRDSIETRHVFDHGFGVVRDGIRAELQKNADDHSTERTNLSHWYRECSTVPVLLPVVMRISAEEPALRDDKDLDYQIASWSTLARRMGDPAYVRDMFETLPFLKDAAEFRALKIQGRGKGTLFGEATERLSNYSDARSGRDGLRIYIYKNKMKPPTFGSDLTLAMLQNGRKDAGLLAFIKKHAAELSQLSPEGREEMAILVRSEIPDFFKPGALDPELRNAAAPLLGTDQKLNHQRVTEIMTAMDIASTHLSQADFTTQAPVLLQSLADTDLLAARKFLTKVTQLILDSESQQKSDQTATSSPVGRWLYNTCSSPQLYSDVMAEAKKLSLLAVDDESDWFMDYAQGLTSWTKLTNAQRLIGFLENSPLLNDAAQFDPISMVNRQAQFHTIIELLASNLRMVPVDKNVLAGLLDYLSKRTPRTFGSDLVSAMFADDPVAAMAAFATSHETDWAKIPPGERRLALAGLYRPLITRLEAARYPSTDRVKQVLQPVLEEESQEQRKFLERLMQAQSLDELSKHYLFQRPLTWLLEWMVSTHEGDSKAALAKACRLYNDGAKESSNWDKKLSTSVMARLLISLAHSPRLQELVLDEASHWGLASDPQFLHQVHDSHFFLSSFWRGGTTAMSMVRTSPFFDGLDRFDSLPFSEKGKSSSELENFVSYARGVWWPYVRSQFQERLAKEPAGFGRDLLLAAMDEAPYEKFPDFLKAHADGVAKLPPEQRSAIERLNERLMAVKKKSR